jgi:putative acetyltransferase
MGGQGCALVGDPNYYKRFGFKNIPDLIMKVFHKKSFLSCRLIKKYLKELSCFTKVFWQTANQCIQAGVPPAPLMPGVR